MRQLSEIDSTIEFAELTADLERVRTYMLLKLQEEIRHELALRELSPQRGPGELGKRL